MKNILALAVVSCLSAVSAFATSNSNDQIQRFDPLKSYDAAQGNRLANNALARDGYASGGACYYWAAEAMEASGVLTRADWGRLGIGIESAYMFADFANANPVTLQSELGLMRVDNLGITTTRAPIGSIFVYDAGVCGYNARHGHIEIVADTGYACSDFCHYFKTENDCGGEKPFIYMPVKQK